MTHDAHAFGKRWLEAAFVGLLPPLLFFAYSVSPINQSDSLDAYVYTGYIHNFSDLIDRHGTTYYSVRFGLILPGILLTKVFGPEAGYFALVFAFYLVAGIPLYLALRKSWGVTGACLGYLTFVSNVWVARTLLWQYVDSAVVAYLVGATALILLAPRHRLAYVVAGALFGLAVHSNAFATAFVALAVIPYGIMNAGSIRQRLRLDALCVAAGLAAVTVMGILFFGLATGDWNIFAPTLRMITAGPQGSHPPLTPGLYLSMPWLRYPLFVLIAGGLVWLQPSARSRPFCAALLYASACGLFFLAWGLFGRVWSLPYYASILAGFVMPVAAMIPAAIVTAGRTSAPQRVLVLVLMALVPPGWIALDAVARAVNLATLLIVMALVLAVIWLSPRSRPLAIAACVLFAATTHLQFVAGLGRSLDPGYFRVFGVRDTLEWDAYRVALQLISAMPKFADDGQVLKFWYPPESRDPLRPDRLDGMQSTYLWLSSRLHGGDWERGSPQIGDHERALLTDREFHLALLATRKEQLSEARAALQKEGIRFSSLFARDLCAGKRCVSVELLHLRPWGYRLSGGADTPGRVVLAADARGLDQTLGRNLYGRSGRDRAVSWEGDRLVFHPTDRRDHLATGFIGAGEPPGNRPRVVRLIAAMPGKPAGRCHMRLQSQQLRSLGDAACNHAAGGATDADVSEFALPADVAAFRLVFVSANGRRADLPSSVRIEVVEALPARRYADR